MQDLDYHLRLLAWVTLHVLCRACPLFLESFKVSFIVFLFALYVHASGLSVSLFSDMLCTLFPWIHLAKCSTKNLH